MHCHYANVREPCNKQLQSEDNPIKPHWTKSPRQTRYFLQPSCLMISVSDTRRGIDFDKVLADAFRIRNTATITNRASSG
ncbi:hypothetical protein AcW1_010245 [Taiwanofungus camphoratus]|nr:hypothetical protein AcW2_010270 [Antrodia cinnamomea]KAI0962093.1 hypothetical protein AcV7_010350 [Antrodia cinnamomea]KAI0964102.1 hypothetical protein AcW1_010245 [Antrodia cinnamomea]